MIEHSPLNILIDIHFNHIHFSPLVLLWRPWGSLKQITCDLYFMNRIMPQSHLSAHLTRVYLGTFPKFNPLSQLLLNSKEVKATEFYSIGSVIALLCFVTNTLKLSSRLVLIQIYVKGQDMYHCYLKNNSKCPPWHGSKRAIATGKTASLKKIRCDLLP